MECKKMKVVKEEDKKEEEEEKIKSLLTITFEYMTKQCKISYNCLEAKIEDIRWNEASLFCLAFKIKEKLYTDCFYWSICTCEPFQCKRFYFDPDHGKIPYFANKNSDHSITFSCNGCAFRDHICKMSSELLHNPDDIFKIR